MKIYTRTGDKGTTSLIGGTRVPKYHIRIDAYGTIDELISYAGLIRDQKIDKPTKKILIIIQDRLMTCASILATDYENCNVKIPKMYEEDIVMLEKEMDKMEKVLPPLNSSILPGGHTTVSYCHITRNVCRRAERKVVKLAQEVKYCDLVIKYLNRLSDYFFVLSRKFSNDLNAEEIFWDTRL